MNYKLENLYAYRFYEKQDGPFVSIRQFDAQQVERIGRDAGITNIEEIYRNRKIIEDLLYKLFVKSGGKPQLDYPYYAAVYDELPRGNQLHVRFHEPECIKIPMHAFARSRVSFTYCQSPRAFTRRDNHPTRRKLLLWDEAEKAINEFPFDENEDTWLEMQIWEESTVRRYYQAGGDCIRSFPVKERLGTADREALIDKYAPFLTRIKADYFFEPASVHGVSHAKRVLVLSQELAALYGLCDLHKELLSYCAAFHDIGRVNHMVDDSHGCKSYEKMERLGLLPEDLDPESKAVVRFIVENHPIAPRLARERLMAYPIKDREAAYRAYEVLKDADTLDRCRFGHVDKSYLCGRRSKELLHFAYQLLRIYREIF